MKQSSSYGDILRSSLLVGAASALNIAIGIVRTKVIATMLGPSGIGLLGILNSIADLARSGADLGVNASGVRRIAEASGSGDPARVARTVLVLERLSLWLGLAGGAALALLAMPIADLTFGSTAHAGAVGLLGLAVLSRIGADARSAVVQGTRRIADMARINVHAALLGTAASVSVIAWLGIDGVAWSIIALAAASAIVGWWYRRKIQLQAVALEPPDVRNEVRALLQMGIAFMATTLLMLGAAYAIRQIVVRQLGLHEAGLYQASWTLASLYVGVLLQAMSADFYPRLVGAAGDHAQTNRLVNEQAHVSLLLAGAGVTATMCLAEFVIAVFYSAAFVDATSTLRWMCLGMALRVVSFPVGYIIVASGRRNAFVATELAFTVVHVGLAWVLVQRFGLPGAGMAFSASYVFHIMVIYPLTRRMTGFGWTRENAALTALVLAAVGSVFLAFAFLPKPQAIGLGLAITIVMGVAFLRRLRILFATTSASDSRLVARLERLEFLKRWLRR